MEPDLDAIETRAKAATPGPWITRNVEGGHGHPPTVITKDGFFTIAPVQSWDQRPENAKFIAHARTDVPALVAEVRRLRAVVVEMRALRMATDNWRQACLDSNADDMDRANREAAAASSKLHNLGIGL